MCHNLDLLTATRGDKGEQSQAIRLGRRLQADRGRIIDGFKLRAERNTNSKTWEYSLVKTELAGVEPEPDPQADKTGSLDLGEDF